MRIFSTSFWLWGFVIFNTGMAVAQQDSLRKINIIAHRGASGLAPENTMAAFAKALEYRVDFIELDVHLSKDDSILVMHDRRIDRTTKDQGEIAAFTYDYLKTLDAGSWLDTSYGRERIPTLRQVLRYVDGRTKVLIELKWPEAGIYEKLARLVVQTVRDCRAESWVVVQSFEPRYLEQIHQMAPEIRCQQLVFAVPGHLPFYHGRSLGFGTFEPLPFVESVNVSYLYLNGRFIREMHARGKTVFVYTVDQEKKARRAIRLGVDGIITNRPDVVGKLLER